MNYDEMYNEALKKYQENDYIKSIEILNTIIEKNENHHYSWYLLGNIFLNLNDLNSAKEFFLVAINKKSDFFDAYFILGNILFEAELFQEALDIWLEGTKYKSDFETIFSNIAIAYEKLNKYQNAISYALRAISLKKDCIEALFSLARIYQKQQNIEQSIFYLNKIIHFDSANVLAHFQLAYSYLFLQRYKEGFSHFEYRKKMINREKEFNYLPFKQYKGENLKDKKILLYHEQGFGDNIQFIRFINNLECKDLSIGIQNPLNKLFSYSFPNIDFLSTIYSSMDFDCMDALMSLPYICKTNSICNEKYLDVDKKDVEQFKEKYLNNKRLNIGLVWKGSTASDKNDVKSILLKELNLILQKENCNFYSLQIENFEEIESSKVINIGEKFKNFYETAVALKGLDVFIGVDTAVSHLAGALGIQTYLIYESNDIDFRWSAINRKSLWYESVRVFSRNEIHIISEEIDILLKDKII